MKRNRGTGMMRRLLALGTAISSIVALTACGSGSGGGSGGATATPVTSSGAITAKGSIFVNGVEFETESSRLEMENELPVTVGVDDSRLRVGMVVKVEGEVNADGRTGRATRIVFEDNLEGPIASVTSTSPLVKTIVVMGQTVIVEDGVTVFDNSSAGLTTFADLDAADVGVVVEISGFPRADGAIVATFIEKKADTLAAFVGAGNLFEVKGTVSNLTANTFNIGGLLISFSGPVAGLANGATVEVKGNSFAGAALVAQSVEVEDEGLDDMAKAEVEGIVSGLNTGAKTFVVNGQLVSYAAAAFLGGLEADLADGARVEAEGPIVGGTLNAVKVVFKESVRIEGNIASFTGGILVLDNFSPAISIQVDDAATRFKPGQTSADLAPGDGVKIRARQSGSNLVATRIEEINPVQDVTIQGPVTAINGESITILGITINTATIANTDDSGGSNFEIEDSPVSRAAFLAALGTGDIVKAKARLDGGTLTWREIEIEMED